MAFRSPDTFADNKWENSACLRLFRIGITTKPRENVAGPRRARLTARMIGKTSCQVLIGRTVSDSGVVTDIVHSIEKRARATDTSMHQRTLKRQKAWRSRKESDERLRSIFRLIAARAPTEIRGGLAESRYSRWLGDP